MPPYLRGKRVPRVPYNKVPILQNERIYIGTDGLGSKAWFGEKPQAEIDLLMQPESRHDRYAVYTSSKGDELLPHGVMNVHEVDITVETEDETPFGHLDRATRMDQILWWWDDIWLGKWPFKPEAGGSARTVAEEKRKIREIGVGNNPEPSKRKKKAAKKRRTDKQPEDTGCTGRPFCDNEDDEEELPQKTIKKEPQDEDMTAGEGAVDSHARGMLHERTRDNAEVEMMKVLAEFVDKLTSHARHFCDRTTEGDKVKLFSLANTLIKPQHLDEFFSASKAVVLVFQDYSDKVMPVLEQHQKHLGSAIAQKLPQYVIETERASLARLQDHLRDVVPDLESLRSDIANLELEARNVAVSVMDSSLGVRFGQLATGDDQIGEDITVKHKR